MEHIKQILASHPFLKDIKPEYIPIIAERATQRTFSAGQLILSEGEETTRFYLIIKGKIAVEIFDAKQGPIIIETLEAGEILGWSWMLPPYQWHFDARAVETTEAISLDAPYLRAQCEKSPELGYRLAMKIMQVIAHRLQSTRIQLLDLYGH